MFGVSLVFTEHHERKIDITVGGSCVLCITYPIVRGYVWEILMKLCLLVSTSAELFGLKLT